MHVLCHQPGSDDLFRFFSLTAIAGVCGFEWCPLLNRLHRMQGGGEHNLLCQCLSALPCAVVLCVARRVLGRAVEVFLVPNTDVNGGVCHDVITEEHL